MVYKHSMECIYKMYYILNYLYGVKYSNFSVIYSHRYIESKKNKNKTKGESIENAVVSLIYFFEHPMKGCN